MCGLSDFGWRILDFWSSDSNLEPPYCSSPSSFEAGWLPVFSGRAVVVSLIERWREAFSETDTERLGWIKQFKSPLKLTIQLSVILLMRRLRIWRDGKWAFSPVVPPSSGLSDAIKRFWPNTFKPSVQTSGASEEDFLREDTGVTLVARKT